MFAAGGQSSSTCEVSSVNHTSFTTGSATEDSNNTTNILQNSFQSTSFTPFPAPTKFQPQQTQS